MGFTTTGSVTSASAPQITADLPSRITKRAGERLDLRCTVGGTPNPVVSWRRDGETISGNNPRISCVDGNRRLLIRNLTVQDAGVYTCVVRNQHGEVSRSSRVVVQANNVNELPNILEQPQDEFVVGGQQATLSCVSTVPPSQFYGIVWKKDGQLLKETNRCKYRREHISRYTIRATYTISQARPEDRGMYTAEISTCIHSISSKAGYLDVRWDFCYWPFSSTPYCDRILH